MVCMEGVYTVQVRLQVIEIVLFAS